MKLKLERKLSVELLRIQMEISIQQPAGLYYNYVQLASEMGVINTEILVDYFKFSHPMAERAIKRCEFFKLIKEDPNLEDNYQLDELGKIMLKDSKIFRRESGEYLIYFTQDPLIPQQIITIKRVNSKESLEKKSKKEEIVKRNLGITERMIQNLMPGNDTEEGGFINSSEIIIESCSENIIIETIRNTKLDIKSILEPSGIKLKIQGLLDNKQIERSLNQIPEDYSYESIFQELFTQHNWFQHWDASLKVSREKFDLNQRNTNYKKFNKKYTIPTPNTSHFGQFNDTALILPIIPRTQDDLIKWELYLLGEEITRIISPSEYKLIKEKIENDMESRCKNYSILPNQNTFAQELLTRSLSSSGEYEIRSSKYWFLQIPLDLPQNNNRF